MSDSTKAALLAICLSGILEGLAQPSQSAALSGQVVGMGNQPANAVAQSKDGKQDKHSCKGQNSCKGKGGCKSGDNGCKGKNACKGKGGCATEGARPGQEGGTPGTRPDPKTQGERPGQEGGTPGARPDPKEQH